MEADSVTLSQDGICKYGECLNRPGSYECQCYDGYENRGEGCVDVNECADRCLEHGTCTNYEGSFSALVAMFFLLGSTLADSGLSSSIFYY